MITFENVTKILGQKTVLDGIDVEIKDGETFVIVGASGAGKSVMLKNIVRLLTPDDGRVMIDGDCISEASANELETIREKFGVLFQSGALLAWMSIGENVALPLREKTDMDETEIVDRAREKLALVGLEDSFHKLPSEISGGMVKRAALARAIVRNPRIVLYDEPTSGLDPVTARTIDSLIEQMRRELAVTSVVVTHDLHSALAIGTRIAMLHSGRIIELSTPDAFIRSAEPIVKGFLESQYITKRGSWEGATK